ncbi:MAG: hypothetical protein Q4D98_03455 [Planctomycetia bacterium]|nr:hypothetical protein [Planctomycetia bacterium]
MTQQKTNDPRRYSMAATVMYSGVQEVDANHGLIAIKARGHKVVEFWGERQIHDFAGMSVPERIVLDRDHDSGKILGYADNIRLTEFGLEMDGHLFRDLPAASEIWPVLKNGVPQQASILFSPEAIEEIPDKYTVEVNGQTEDGPLIVFRKWKLDSVAVCCYGVDDTTGITPIQMSTQFVGNGGKGTEKMGIFGKKKYAEDTEEKKDDQQGCSEGGEGGGENPPTDEKDAKIATLEQQVAELTAKINALESAGSGTPGQVENSDDPKDEETKKEFSRIRGEIGGLKESITKVSETVAKMYANTRMGFDPMEGVEKKEYADDRSYLIALESAKLAGTRR